MKELSIDEIKELDRINPRRRRFYIYETHIIPTDHYYVGQSFASHRPPEKSKYLGSGDILRAEIKKYGRSSAERRVICQTTDNKNLDLLEKYYISECRRVHGDYLKDPNGKCINIGDGGHGSCEAQLETNKKNHGGVLAFNTAESIEKSLITRVEKYGSTTVMCSSESAIQNRMSTLTEKYGAPTAHMNTDSAIANRMSTNKEKYGSPCGQMRTEAAIAKIKESASRRYGGDPYGMIHSEEARKKAAKSTKEKKLSNRHKLVGPDGSTHTTSYYKYWLRSHPGWIDLGNIKDITPDQSDDRID